MTTASSSRRVPQGEVVMEFADGGSYIQSKMETAVLDLERKRINRDKETKTAEEGKKAAKAMEALNVSSSSSSPKAEDVALIVSQLGCTKAEAEEALKANKGDLVATLIKLVQPRQRAKSVDGGGEIRA